MKRHSQRAQRVADQIQRELAQLLRDEVKDPRVGMITLTDVEVTPDHRHARVFFTLLGEPAQIEETARALQHAAGFLRSQLAHRFEMRTVPQLQFVHDPSVERGMQLSQLIDSARADDAKRARRRKRS
jgi:ribosome-binding factor A